MDDVRLNENSFTDLYDSQGRLISIEAGISHSRKKAATSISIEGEGKEELRTAAYWTTNIHKLIDEILPILSSNENINSNQIDSFHSIKDLLSRYDLGDFSTWACLVLKRLNCTLLTIKQLIEKPNNIDLVYLNILITRIQQRVSNIDLGIHYTNDEPHIIEQLKYEDVLDERRKNKCVFKSLSALNERFDIQCLSYIQTCLDLHSNVRVMGIGKDNIEQLAAQLNLIPLTEDERKYLSQKCDPLVIPLRSFVSCTTTHSSVFDHYNQWSLLETQRHSLTNNFKQQTLSNDSRDIYRLIAETPFIPSSQFDSNFSTGNQNVSIDNILDILENYRWVVFLGDPGSAKTTLARWLTLECAKKFLENKLTNNNLSARLPILVRIGEVASVLDNDSSLSLMDCLCQPTWFSTSLIQTHHDKSFIREYIENGHALIILDGLDEIPNFRQRQHIVRLIEEFLQKWTVCPVTLIAPLDKLVSDNPVKPSLCSSIGNQVIITSRIVGYYLCPLPSSRINHYILAPLSLPNINLFIDHWFQNLDSSLEISKLASS